MILIDTSVWIGFFRQNEAFIEQIQLLLGAREVITIEPVFAELLYGVRNTKEKEIIQSYWQVLPRIGFGKNSMLKAAEFARANNYHQLGIGLMDAIIIKSAKDENHLLWTLDRRINAHIDQKYLFQS